MIRAVGKTHAYCVVVQEKGAGALFRALVDEPTLASYVVVREPERRPERQPERQPEGQRPSLAPPCRPRTRTL